MQDTLLVITDILSEVVKTLTCKARCDCAAWLALKFGARARLFALAPALACPSRGLSLIAELATLTYLHAIRRTTLRPQA